MLIQTHFSLVSSLLGTTELALTFVLKEQQKYLILKLTGYASRLGGEEVSSVYSSCLRGPGSFSG